MKKIHWLCPVVISYLITSLSVFVTPGFIFGSQCAYGFPFAWLWVDNEITMAPKDLLFDHIGIGPGDFLFDLFIYLAIVRALIFLYRVIFKKNKTPDEADKQPPVTPHQSGR